MTQGHAAFTSSDQLSLGHAFAGARYIGASLIRDTVDLDTSFSYASTDTFVANVSSRGFRPYLTLNYRPIEWGGSRTPSVADFSAFCSAVASRYDTQVNDYSVFNEPNSYNWPWSNGTHPVRAVDYGALYRGCYAAIKGVNPGARIYFGELSNGSSSVDLCNYVANAVAAAPTRADAVALHPYQYTSPPGTGLSGSACRGIGRISEWSSRLQAMSNLRTPAGGVLPVAVTEFGYCVNPSSGPCNGAAGSPPDETTRANWLHAAWLIASGYGATIFSYYHLMQDGSPSWNTGIMGLDGTVTASMNTLRAFTGATYGAPGAQTIGFSGVIDGGATLWGNTNAHGLKTSYHFDFGSTQSYGNVIGADDGGSSMDSFTRSVKVTNLRPGTYHYRIVASNAAGTTFGEDKVIDIRGRADVIGRAANTSVQVGLSTGSEFAASTTWGSTSSSDYQLADVDVDGDGRADAVIRDPTTFNLMVSRSTGSSFAAPANWKFWSSDDWHLADVNGDGRADVVGRPASGFMQVGLSTGSEFAASSNWDFWGAASYQLADVDGDGRADIVSRDPTTFNLVAGLSTGTRFANSANWKFWSSDDWHLADTGIR
jgi:hypothetical protein